MILVVFSVWWLLQPVDFNYRKNIHWAQATFFKPIDTTARSSVPDQTDLPSHAAVVKKIVFWILPFYGFLHLQQRHPELCRARRCPALSVLGGEADFVIVTHHRGSPAILNC